MDNVFADACYWIAKLNRRDSLHEIAVLLSDTLDSRRIVTTELVLVEVLNFFAELGQANPRGAAALVRELQAAPDVDVIELSDIRFSDAVDFYNGRPDQEWGLVDCASFLIMENHGIQDALTNDHHFTQAGFNILMQ